MRSFCLLFIALIFPLLNYAQDKDQERGKIAKAVEAEGKKLFRVERAAWMATELMVQEYIQKQEKDPEKIGGYVAYEAEDKVHCIFYQKAKKDRLLAEFSFPTDFPEGKWEGKTTERKASKLEQKLINLREQTTKLFQKDTLFKFYPKTNMNIVPLAGKKESKVYIMTAPTINGVVIFGNDYLLTFNKKNKLISKEVIHKGIHPIDVSKTDEEGTYHIHYTDEPQAMTPTDVCILMLYDHLTDWDQHTVISKTYASLWNGNNNSLLLMDAEVFQNVINREEGDYDKVDNESEKAQKHQKWLDKNEVPINQLYKADPNEIITDCDSMLGLFIEKGDTTTRWVRYGTLSLGFSTFGEKAIREMILKNENFGKTSYVTGLDFQGHIKYISLQKRVFLEREDSLFQLEQFSQLSIDSIKVLVNKIYDTKSEKEKDSYYQILEDNSYEEFKLIFHPAIFDKDNLYTENIHEDVIELMNSLEVDGKKYYRIEIRSANPENKEKRTYVFDEDYRFVDFEACDKKIVEQLAE